MPLRFYDNDDWRTPTNVRIYDDGEWKTASVGYVYDMGTWRVVFPDPIIPDITINNYLIGARQSVYVDVLLTNCDYIVAELYLGTSQSNLISSQTIDTLEDVFDSERITFTGLQNNTTYNMKITAYSITENTYTVLTGPATTINVIIPTASITSITNVSLSGVTVNWTSTNQYYWNVEIYRTSDGAPLTARNPGPPPTPIYGPNDRSWTASFGAIANTQYTVKLTVESISEDPAVSFATFTTPNVIQPTLSSLTATSTCNSITVNWSGSNYVSGTVSLWFPDLQLPSQEWTWGSQQVSYSFNSSTLSSYTFTGLPNSTLYVARIVLVSSTSNQLDSDSVFTWPSGSISGPGNHPFISTLQPSVSAPTNFTATSDFYGKFASFTWTAATGNCTSVTGYRIEYKLNTSSTWSVLSNSIASSSVSFSAGGIGTTTFAPGRTYNFRIFAKSSFGDSATAATVNLTMNNNPYGITMSGTNSIETFSSSVLTGQLVNADYENVSVSGVTITWSFIGGINPPSGSSISPTSAVTNSSGQATTTFSSSSDDGTGTVYADAANLGPFGGGQRVMTVSLRSGLTPSLFWSATASGGTVFNFSYDSNYSYTGSISAGGSLVAGQSYASSSFAVSIPVQDGINQPEMSGDNTNGTGYAGTVTCTISNVWVANPTVSTISVTSSRLGYNSATGSLSNVSPNRSRTTILYELLNTANGNVMFSTSTNNNSVTYQYPGVDVGKVVRWRCTATFSDNSTSTRFSSTRTLG